MKESKLTKTVTVLFIIITALSISLPGAFSSGPLWPDGQRYAFNGILLHDMIRDGAIFHPYEYNIKFYAQYPATNLPYGPPFFAIVFAAAFGLFGISFSVARCVVALYTVGAALMCWYLFYRISRNYWYSLVAVAAFLFNPLTVTYSRDITPELPVAFYCFLTLYFFYYYVESEKKYFGIYSALAFSLGYLTKPYIIPIGISLPIYIVIFKKWNIVYKKETWLAVFITLILILPDTILLFKFTTQDLPTGIPTGWNLLSEHPTTLINSSPVLAILSIIGFIIGSIRRDRLVLLSLIWALSWYTFFTFYVRAEAEKYLVTFIPSMLAAFALASYEVASKIKKMHIGKAIIIFVIITFIYEAWYTPVRYVFGYEDAGRYVAENSRGKSVLFYGRYDGAFMMGIRRHVSQQGLCVLRGDRQLATRLWWGELKDNDSVKSPEDIIKLLNEYQAGYVVVERDMPEAREYQEYINLMTALKDNNYFHQVATFPIIANYGNLGPELIVYKFYFSEGIGKARTLKIPVPSLDRGLDVPF